MSNLIENPKTYTGEESDRIFLRPVFTGENAAELGIRVMYNIPVNMTLNFWQRRDNVLQKYEKGWTGGEASKKYQKTIAMEKVKAEFGMAAEDYFSMVYERMTNTPETNMQDLQGTDIERAEVALFREVISEDSRLTMWVGDTDGTISDRTVYDGFIKRASTYKDSVKVKINAPTKENIIATLDSVWDKASKVLKSLKSTGKLRYYVTSDVYNAYEAYLDGYTNTTAYRDIQNGRGTLNYHGIELHEIHAEDKLKSPASIILLTHKENLLLAVNLRNLPGADVRLWYNPDEMENRQRAVFLAGTEILDESLIVYGATNVTTTASTQSAQTQAAKA